MAPLKPLALSRKAYRPYGDVIAAAGAKAVSANMGTALRFNWLARLASLREGAKPNLCLYRCSPYRRSPIAIKLLERHAFSTQVFIPMDRDARYLVAVALGLGRPDLRTFKVFAARGGQGVSYGPGVWHHPLIALTKTDFACLVWEDGSRADCETRALAEPLLVAF